MRLDAITDVFLVWLEENRSNFQVKPKIISTNHKGVRMNFLSIPNELSAELYYMSTQNYMGIRVTAERNGTVWDFILDYDAHIVLVSNGYICDFCEGEKFIYPTLSELAIKHTFEFFLTWCNEHLAHAQGLALYGQADKGDSSWAQLISRYKDISTLKADYYIPFPSL
jgi:hypothetical protein